MNVPSSANHASLESIGQESKNLDSKNCPILDWQYIIKLVESSSLDSFWAVSNVFEPIRAVRKTVGPIVLNQGPRVDEVIFKTTFRWPFISNER